jgi:uncharacterized membrane protein YgcG
VSATASPAGDLTVGGILIALIQQVGQMNESIRRLECKIDALQPHGWVATTNAAEQSSHEVDRRSSSAATAATAPAVKEDSTDAGATAQQLGQLNERIHRLERRIDGLQPHNRPASMASPARPLHAAVAGPPSHAAAIAEAVAASLRPPHEVFNRSRSAESEPATTTKRKWEEAHHQPPGLPPPSHQEASHVARMFMDLSPPCSPNYIEAVEEEGASTDTDEEAARARTIIGSKKGGSSSSSSSSHTGSSGSSGRSGGSSSSRGSSSSNSSSSMIAAEADLVSNDPTPWERVNGSTLSIGISRIKGAGRGLFTSISIPAGTSILNYQGEKLNADQYWERYGEGTYSRKKRATRNMDRHRYVFKRSSNVFVDASDPALSNRARFVNHGDANVANCRYNQYGTITAVCNIRAGSELLVSYGAQYTRELQRYSPTGPTAESGSSSGSSSNSSGMDGSGGSSVSNVGIGDSTEDTEQALTKEPLNL